MIKFSVLMATYAGDSHRHFEEALASLQWQNITPNEVIIVGDGPIPEKNLSLIKTFSDNLPIRFIQLKENKGLGEALRIGLKHCQYSLVARFDTDDICEANRFEVQLRFMTSHPEVDICGSFATLVDLDGTPKGSLCRPTTHNDIKKIIWSCPMIHPSAIFRKEKILMIGSYKSLPAQRIEDYELWVRAAKRGLRFHNIPKKLIKHRTNERTRIKKNTCMIGYHKVKVALSAWYLYDRRPISFLALCYLMVRPFLPFSLNKFLSQFDPRA